MAYKVQKPCRTCGRMYTPCSDCERDKSSFHWRTVACSMKCAMKYFEKIEESRKLKDDNIDVSVIESVKESENNDYEKISSHDTVVSEDDKPTRINKKKKNNKESEQIG